MAGETKSLGIKDKYDRFYTKPYIVDKCLQHLSLNEYDVIIEPSAGSGNFSHKIDNCIALDLQPAAEDIIQQDYFTFDYTQYVGKKILVVGNPPFGQQCKLALEFFNYSAQYADTIAFVLPKSFCKISIQNRLSLDFGLVCEELLPEKSFELNGIDYDVPCVFQVWERLATPRKKNKMKLTSNYIDFTKNIAEADFRVQRVGGNAGKAFIEKNGAISSNYYIVNKTSLSNEELVGLINTLSYPSIDFTVGPKSLPKGELIEQLESKLEALSY